ncbi:MAG: hypothetical protein ACJ735_01270 [Actinomycetes bacterium]
MNRRVSLARVIAAGAVGAVATTLTVANTTHANATVGVTFHPITTAFNSPIGIDYHEPDNTLVLSVNYNTSGDPNNFDLIHTDGSHTQFSSVTGLSDEVYPAAIRTTSCSDTSGFTVGDVYSGTGTSGEISKISADGATVNTSWAELGDYGLLRGGVTQDRACVFGGNLIVTTDQGYVFTVDSAGNGTLLNPGNPIPAFLEGPTTIPNDAKYGAIAGTIVAGDENNGLIWSIDGAGNVSPYSVDGSSPEGVHIVPANENYYAVNFGGGEVDSVDASELTPFVGDLVVQDEFGGALHDLTWNPDTQGFDSTVIGSVGNDVEGSNFGPVTVNTPVKHLTWNQTPIAPAAQLGTCLGNTVVVEATDASHNPIPFAPIYISLRKTTGSNGLADVNGAALTTAAQMFTADANGDVSVNYNSGTDCSAPTPTGGQDRLRAVNRPVNPKVVAFDTYNFGTVAKYNVKPKPIAKPATLVGGESRSVTVTAKDAGGNAVPGATVYLGFTPTTFGDGGGSASVGGTALTSTLQPFVADGNGHVVVTYTAPTIVPSEGLDVLNVADATKLPAVTAKDTYSFQ